MGAALVSAPWSQGRCIEVAGRPVDVSSGIIEYRRGAGNSCPVGAANVHDEPKGEGAARRFAKRRGGVPFPCRLHLGLKSIGW